MDIAGIATGMFEYRGVIVRWEAEDGRYAYRFTLDGYTSGGYGYRSLAEVELSAHLRIDGLLRETGYKVGRNG